MPVRRATPADAERLGTMNQWVHDPHVAAEPELYCAAPTKALTAVMRERLEGGAFTALIAEDDDGTPRGYVLLTVRDRAASPFAPASRMLYVDQLATDPDARRAGWGRVLMAAAEAEAQRQECHGVQLDVRVANTTATAFYAALGYEPQSISLSRRLSGGD